MKQKGQLPMTKVFTCNYNLLICILSTVYKNVNELFFIK